MTLKTLAALLVFYCLVIIFQSLIPKALAIKRSDQYSLVDDQRSRRNKKDFKHRVIENTMFSGVDNIGVPYAIDSYSPDTKSEELPGLIVDYANLIRNDIILLDNSVETRTRKRGNIKFKESCMLPDVPCNCEDNDKGEIDLNKMYGGVFIPSKIEITNCNPSKCSKPYQCKENNYTITVLKRNVSKEDSVTELPSDLKFRWIAKKLEITVGCTCTRDYVQSNIATGKPKWI